MKKVQNAEKRENAIDELCKRYEERGRSYDRSPEYAEQKTREIETRTTAPRSYKLSSGNASELKKFKNGVAGNRRYMTDGDFAAYYKATREYTPDSNVELDTTVLLQRIDRARYKDKKMKPKKNDVKAKLKAEADRSNPKNVKSVKRGEAPKKAEKQTGSSKIKQVAKEAAKTWIPLEEMNTENIVEGTKSKFPTGVILAIVVVTISLLLIVSSAVLLGSARSERTALQEEIELLDEEIAALKTDLERKNSMADIEIFAEQVLGMIKQEHVKAEYINSNKTDVMEKSESNKNTFLTLITWILEQLD
jgi:hypothetical protein